MQAKQIVQLLVVGYWCQIITWARVIECFWLNIHVITSIQTTWKKQPQVEIDGGVPFNQASKLARGGESSHQWEERRERTSTQTSMIFTCSNCNIACSLRIGLYSHSRRCNSANVYGADSIVLPDRRMPVGYIVDTRYTRFNWGFERFRVVSTFRTGVAFAEEVTVATAILSIFLYIKLLQIQVNFRTLVFRQMTVATCAFLRDILKTLNLA